VFKAMKDLGIPPEKTLTMLEAIAPAMNMQNQSELDFTKAHLASSKVAEQLYKDYMMLQLAGRRVENQEKNVNSQVDARQGAPMSEGDITSAGAQIAQGQPISQVIPGYGAASGKMRERAREEAINQIMAETGMDKKSAGTELARRSIDFVAGKRSVTQLNTMYGATKQAIDQLEFNVNKVSETMAKLPSSDLSPVINAIARGEQKWTGEPAYAALFYYMHAAGMESARILQGGQASVAQLHQGAADEAKKWADANMTTPAAWNEGVAPAMMEEGRYRLKSYKDAIGSQRVTTPPTGAYSGDDVGKKRGEPGAASGPASTNAKGWQLMTDKNGQKAYVSPDKTQFEAVP